MYCKSGASRMFFREKVSDSTWKLCPVISLILQKKEGGGWDGLMETERRKKI